MVTCLKYLVPISCFLFLGATMWPLVLMAALGRPTLLQPLGERIAQPDPYDAAVSAMPDGRDESMTIAGRVR
jgi:NADH-quinone oxidoreductase subunit H